MERLLEDNLDYHMVEQEGEQKPLLGDQKQGLYYHYFPELIQAINVALITTRPLLLCGNAGCGKSSLAANLAHLLKHKFYEYVVTSRTQAHDLLWHFDHVRRLADANSNMLPKPPLDRFNYLNPGPLWWAFDAKSAQNRGYLQFSGKTEDNALTDKFELANDPCRDLGQEYQEDSPSIVLIDEIDKAEPDIPNNLLQVLGAKTFDVPEIQSSVTLPDDIAEDAERHPLIIITTNQERELPPAFVRRCITFRFPKITAKRLTEIAKNTFPNSRKLDTICDQVLQQFDEDKLPEIAEFIDTVRAALVLTERPGWDKHKWPELIRLTADKQQQLRG